MVPTDEALAAATKLSVARSARLLATLCSALAPDPLRLNREQFLAATPSATHAGVLACQPGSVVALLRKGMKLTRERYLDMRAAPEGWIPLRELRPVERAVVRAVAYRGAVPPPPEYPDISGTPPCCWVLLELLDPGMIIPGRRKSGEAPREGPRLVSAPVFAGGEIADYLIPWEKYATAAERPWAKGARIQMFSEDLTAGADRTPRSLRPRTISPRRRRTALRTERTRRTARSGTSECRRRRGGRIGSRSRNRRNRRRRAGRHTREGGEGGHHQGRERCGVLARRVNCAAATIHGRTRR